MSASEGGSERSEKRILTEALSLSPAQQYRLAFLIAENIGYAIIKDEANDEG